MTKKATPPKAVIVNGQSFESITKAAFGMGIRRTEISKAVKQSKSTEVFISKTGARKRVPTEKVKLVQKGKKKKSPNKPFDKKATNRKKAKAKR